MRTNRVFVVAVTLTLAWAPVRAPSATSLAVRLDLSAGRHAIPNAIYGMNFADATFAREIGLAVDRWGGNSVERYNWRAGNTNSGNDYFFENVADCWSADQQWCANSNYTTYRSWRSRFDADHSRGTSPLVTLPLLKYVAKTPVKYDHPLDCGFPRSVIASANYDPYDTNCGDGKTSSGAWATGAHPSLTSTAIDYNTYDGGWIDKLVARYGDAAHGGVRYYELGNEPALWSSTHHDVRDTRLGYDEEYAKASALAAVVKAHDPGASVLGPSDWGWLAYLCSDADLAVGYCSASSPDRTKHGGKEFAAWYLAKFAAYQAANGVRILDYLDEHYYPQGGSSPDITRSLWDPTYVDPSWINATIRLIPRMRDWIAQNYPGTKIAISEYDFGHHSEMLGAVLEADVLGIFGRERVDLATMWSPPGRTEPSAFAFRMYRNYDGAGSTFGDVGVATTSANQSIVAAYGAQRTLDSAATLVLVNKSTTAVTVDATFAGSSATHAGVWRYSSAALGSIKHPADVALASGGPGEVRGTVTLPAMSVTMLVAA